MLRDVVYVAVELYNKLREQSQFNIFTGIKFDDKTSRHNRIIIEVSTALPEDILLIPESYEGYKVIYREVLYKR